MVSAAHGNPGVAPSVVEQSPAGNGLVIAVVSAREDRRRPLSTCPRGEQASPAGRLAPRRPRIALRGRPRARQLSPSASWSSSPARHLVGRWSRRRRQPVVRDGDDPCPAGSLNSTSPRTSSASVVDHAGMKLLFSPVVSFQRATAETADPGLSRGTRRGARWDRRAGRVLAVACRRGLLHLHQELDVVLRLLEGFGPAPAQRVALSPESTRRSQTIASSSWLISSSSRRVPDWTASMAGNSRLSAKSPQPDLQCCRCP